MGFTLCPDDGYPRIWRFVASGVLPTGVLCTLDRERNILTIDREAFDKLTPADKHQVLRTTQAQIGYALAAA